MSRQSLVFLLDSAPATWTSQLDRHARLSEALVRRGVPPILVFAQPLRADMRARLEASGARVEVITYGDGAYAYCRALRTLVKACSITTAHIIFFDYFSPLPWIARLSGVRTIIYEMQNSGELRATSWKRRLLRLRTRVMTKPVVRAIAISDFVKRQLANAGLEEKKLVVRYLGVDTERFRPDPKARQEWIQRFSIAPDELILSTVTYLRPFKNPQVLVRACQELAQRNVRARLFVAGGGEMLPGLKALGEQLGFGDRICWLGNVAEPKTLLQASDIFLLASVGEAFGLVLAEAMACGVPVVGSRSGSLLEVVADQRTGLLATPLDPVSFADSIEHLARNEDLRKDMGARALERVYEHFTVERAVQKTLDIYEGLWQSAARSPA